MSKVTNAHHDSDVVSIVIRKRSVAAHQEVLSLEKADEVRRMKGHHLEVMIQSITL